MKKIGIIYVAINEVNGMTYVGQTTQTLKNRKRRGYNPYFQNAINKYGEKIKWEIIGKFFIEELDLLERCYIWGLNTMFPYGYNFEAGGRKNKIVSEETKKKLSEARMGEKNHMFGKHHSEETKRILSKINTGNKLTEKTKRKMSESKKGNKHNMFGKHHSEETKRKISESKKGKSLPPRTTEYRKKLSEAHAGEKSYAAKLSWKIVNEIRQKYKSNNYTQAELAKQFNVVHQTIHKIIHNKSWKI